MRVCRDVLAEEGRVDPGRQHWAQPLDEVERHSVVDNRLLRVADLAGLGTHRLHNSRVAVASAQDPDAGGEIQVPLTVASEDLAAFATVNDELSQPLDAGKKATMILEWSAVAD